MGNTTIPCKVDTQPMADQMKNVSVQVDRTTQAVVSMEAAVILAEKEGAEKVCKNVNMGFFTMIQSQISQKIASNYSRVDALLMQLKHQSRRLLGIKNNMEKEYVRICDRYYKIFTSINKELERRIKELDRPVFDLVTKQMVTTTNRMNSLAAWAGLIQLEDLTKGQSIMMSNFKWDANKALNKSHSFLSHMAYQKKLTDSILIENPYDNKSHACDIPVGIMETVNNDSGISLKSVTVCEGINKDKARKIDDMVVRSESLDWQDSEKDQRVEEEFFKLMENGRASSRVKEMIRKIYESNNPQTL